MLRPLRHALGTPVAFQVTQRVPRSKLVANSSLLMVFYSNGCPAIKGNGHQQIEKNRKEIYPFHISQQQG